MSNKNPQSHPSWQALQSHAQELDNTSINALFQDAPSRFDAFHVQTADLLFDYSKQRVTGKTLELFEQLIKESHLQEKLSAMISGGIVNTTENRAALHTALRAQEPPSLTIDGEDIAPFIRKLRKQIKTISDNIRADKNITDVIHIGVGGSDLGPRMVCRALQDLHDHSPKIHFLNNIDRRTIDNLLGSLNPEHTCVIIASKTFTTLETCEIAARVSQWQDSQGSNNKNNSYAITSATHKAEEQGIPPDHILPMRDWIGGRFSLWGAIGLPIAIAYGYEVFEELQNGAHIIDTMLMNAPLRENIPLLMALIGVFNRNFYNYKALAILPYADALELLPTFLQQLDMESNGKAASVQTGPAIFGGVGTGAQHAFMQAFHQGTDIIPCDFIIRAPLKGNTLGIHLAANAIAQAQALMQGKATPDSPHTHFEGNRPSNCLVLKNFSASTIGQLIALYEHKIAIQGFIWNINSFDQWGVTLGKELAHKIMDEMQNPSSNSEDDSSTKALIHAIVEQS